MSDPDSPRTPATDSSDQSYMARSMSTTVFTRARKTDRSAQRNSAKSGSRLGKLDESMMKRTHSVSVSDMFQSRVLFAWTLRCLFEVVCDES